RRGAERGARFGSGGLEGALELALCADDFYAAAAAARGRFDEHKKTDLLRARLSRPGVVDLLRSPSDRPAEFLRESARGELVAHRADALGGRSDKFDMVFRACLGELGALGQEAVARMECVGLVFFRGGDDAPDIEIAFARPRGADDDGAVRGPGE